MEFDEKSISFSAITSLSKVTLIDCFYFEPCSSPPSLSCSYEYKVNALWFQHPPSDLNRFRAGYEHMN
eukprot:scaffold12990_cov108-Cylindrotheca_fusiformis.AAC.4